MVLPELKRPTTAMRREGMVFCLNFKEEAGWDLLAGLDVWRESLLIAFEAEELSGKADLMYTEGNGTGFVGVPFLEIGCRPD